MKHLTNKEFEEWKEFKRKESLNLILTDSFIEYICEANNNNPEQIGKQILEIRLIMRERGEK